MNSSDPIINNISRSKSKRSLNQNLITNFATLSNDIKKNLTQSIYNKTLETYTDISIDKSNKFSMPGPGSYNSISCFDLNHLASFHAWITSAGACTNSNNTPQALFGCTNVTSNPDAPFLIPPTIFTPYSI